MTSVDKLVKFQGEVKGLVTSPSNVKFSLNNGFDLYFLMGNFANDYLLRPGANVEFTAYLNKGVEKGDVLKVQSLKTNNLGVRMHIYGVK